MTRDGEFIRVLVCGGRDFANQTLLFSTLDHVEQVLGRRLHVGSGGASGADTLAELWALERGRPRHIICADWGTHGRRAGPIRNERLLREFQPEICLGFKGGAGTRHMMSICTAAEVPTAAVTEEGELFWTRSQDAERFMRGGL